MSARPSGTHGAVVHVEMVEQKNDHLKKFEAKINDLLTAVPSVKDGGATAYAADIRIMRRDEGSQCTVTYRLHNEHPTVAVTTVPHFPDIDKFSMAVSKALKQGPDGAIALDVRIAPWSDDCTIGVITWRVSA